MKKVLNLKTSRNSKKMNKMNLGRYKIAKRN